jgi:uncharacterized protein YbjQ (UPF0145 family)
MIIATTDKLEGRNITETLGLIEGSATRARNVFSDIGAGLKGLVGGEIGGYTKLMEATRESALDRLIEEAEGMGADAVVGVRMSTSMIMQGVSEIVIYGTAVKLS